MFSIFSNIFKMQKKKWKSKIFKHKKNTYQQQNKQRRKKKTHLFIKHYLPVKMFWKAVSTLVESSADVSMNDKLLRSLRTAKDSYRFIV